MMGTDNGTMNERKDVEVLLKDQKDVDNIKS